MTEKWSDRKSAGGQARCWSGIVAFGLLLISAALNSAVLNLAAAADSPSLPAAASGDAEPAVRDAEPKDQQRAVAIGFYLLFGIVFLGLVLLLWVIWWGIRLRQAVRQPLPRVSRNNELWYLKGGRKLPQGPAHGSGPPPDDNADPSSESRTT